VTQLRQLNLQLAFETARALRKNIENESGTIQHPALQQCFEVTFLARAQWMIEHDQFGAECLDLLVDFFSLATADIKPWIR
jgi:hypothetical protein